jgi:hypothetical protein
VWRVLGIISWVFIVSVLAAGLYIFTYLIVSTTPMGPQNTGLFPQVISCVQQHPRHEPSDPHWQPTLKVTVEPPCATLDESGSTTHSGAPSTTSDTSDE